jgi:hypothetical protein
VAFTAELLAAGIAGSIGTVGDALDNALCESTIGLFKTEALTDGFGATVGDAAGVEVGKQLLAPGLEGAAEPSHLGDRARREAGDHLLRDPPTLGGGGVVDGRSCW